MPIDRIRDILYNIEQFKADALKLPNIGPSERPALKERSSSKSKGKQASSDQGAVYGDAAKSAGSLNDKTSQGASKIMSN